MATIRKMATTEPAAQMELAEMKSTQEKASIGQSTQNGRTEHELGEFSTLRSIFWPIYDYELKKFLPMFILFFCISFVYTVVRDTKDTLIVTAPGSGAEAIPFLKVWCVVPSAIVFTVVYSKMSNTLDKETLFYATLAPFLLFFGFFGFVLYPCREFLHPYESAKWLREEVLPDNAAAKGIVAIYQNWTFAVFYIFAEMWGSMVLSLVFWGFANDITRTTEAKRFYGLLGIGANLALVFSGQAIIWAAADTDRPYGESLKVLMLMVLMAGGVIIVVYYWMNRTVLTDPCLFNSSQVKQKKGKPSLGISDSVKLLVQSPYLGLMTAIVLAYGASINLVEVVWKSQLKEQYSNPMEYSNFMGHFSMATGITTMFMFLFVSHNVIRRLGWTFAALVTPVVLAITGVLFLTFTLFRNDLTGVAMKMNSTPLFLAVIFGAAQNILTKSSKYSLFDPTKEMAYIPLDQESKVKGKAAIDVVGARLGKSLGSMIQQVLSFFVPTVFAMAPYLGFIFLLIVVGWLWAARTLGGLYKQKVAGEATRKATV